jgi:DNA ligase (NAD+)
MDIDGLGYKTIDFLLGEDKINDPADIFTLTAGDFAGFDGWADVSTSNLLAGVEAARDRPLSKLIVALGVRHVGPSAAKELARRFRSMDALLEVDAEELTALDGIGEVIASAWTEWADDQENRRLIERMSAAGVRMSDPEAIGGGSDLLEGLTFVISGTLDGMSRDDVKAQLEERGAKVTGSVSKKTTALIVGGDPGASKVSRAESLGVTIIGDGELLALLVDGYPTQST